ncbi:TonB-dependent receptor, partial [Acidobacteriia bacterium AH_259_A11_L15]|nr:TonB-dependent receptor [Acidobacteriia bacterium AH_259_A11_L15]
MRSAWVNVVLFVFILTALAVVPASAQFTPATVSGTVTDPTGAVIPGAQVRLMNEATGVVREQETTGGGFFRFERMQPGTYTVRITVAGFRTYQQTGLAVSTGKVTSLGSVVLEVGATAEVITVEATAAPLMQTESAQITGNYSARQVSEVIHGFLGLDATAFLTPGVQPGVGGGFSNANTAAGSTGIGSITGLNSDMSVNGMRGRSNNFTLDGQSINDISVAGPALFVSNLDVVEEYQITTNQFNADQGRNLGATINIITKSGSNEVHGSVFWFTENSRFWAVNASESKNDIHKPATFIDNFGGFTIGGPAVPDKLFVFGSFWLERSPGTAFARSNGLAVTDTGMATLLAAFPASDTIALYAAQGALQKFGPLGSPAECQLGTTTTAEAATGSAFAGIAGVEVCNPQRLNPANFVEEEGYVRIDWAGERHSISGRYFIEDNAFCCWSSVVGSVDGFDVALPARSQALGISHTYQLTPRMLNEFRFNFSRLRALFEGGGSFPAQDIGKNITLIDLPSPFLDFGCCGGFTIFPQGRIVTDFQFQNNWSLVWGRHTFKAGADIRRNRTTSFFLPGVLGAYTFDTT